MTVLGVASAADLLRLFVVPAFAWAAYRDVLTRRLPNKLWPPLLAVGVVALALDVLRFAPFTGYESRLFLVRVGFALLFLVPFSLLAYRLAAFGGADTKALIVLAVTYPATPEYVVPLWLLPETSWLHTAVFPLHPSALGVTAMSALTNAVLFGLLYVVHIGVRNAVAGRFSPAMFVGTPTAVSRLPDRHGSLLDTDGAVPTRGLDLDALRMYLRWRGCTLAELRRDPAAHRDPTSVGATNDPTDGAVDADVPDVAETTPRPDGGAPTDDAAAVDAAVESAADGVAAEDDPWAADRFLAEISGTAYGTTPETLREGLDRLAERDVVWVSPGLPFVAPLFAGLVVALTYGDVLTELLRLVGVL
ncbi:prepilin peptidase [Halobaculum sp. D14]|uniref:prepilin peptidase n=1 Tax=Halobaculum sp. D14 TaxID=3421642 RepID=UPI003EC00040